jgi:hypothetical protein
MGSSTAHCTKPQHQQHLPVRLLQLYCQNHLQLSDPPLLLLHRQQLLLLLHRQQLLLLLLHRQQLLLHRQQLLLLLLQRQQLLLLLLHRQQLLLRSTGAAPAAAAAAAAEPYSGSIASVSTFSWSSTCVYVQYKAGRRVSKECWVLNTRTCIQPFQLRRVVVYTSRQVRTVSKPQLFVGWVLQKQWKVVGKRQAELRLWEACNCVHPLLK